MPSAHVCFGAEDAHSKVHNIPSKLQAQAPKKRVLISTIYWSVNNHNKDTLIITHIFFHVRRHLQISNI